MCIFGLVGFIAGVKGEEKKRRLVDIVHFGLEAHKNFMVIKVF